MRLFGTVPPPTDFAEGQRLRFGQWMTAAGVAYGLATICAIALVLFLKWSPELERLQLLILGAAGFFGSVGSILVTVAFAVGGPVGRLSAEAQLGNTKVSTSVETKETRVIEKEGEK